MVQRIRGVILYANRLNYDIAFVVLDKLVYRSGNRVAYRDAIFTSVNLPSLYPKYGVTLCVRWK